MANHKTHAQFDRAKWRMKILFPTWFIQLALTFAQMSLFTWRLDDTIYHYDEMEKVGGVPMVELVWEVTNVGLSLVASICTFFEIYRYFAESLTPWTMLFTHVIKLTCAVAIMVLDIIVYTQRHDRHYSLIGLGIDAAFIVTAIVLVVYVGIIYQRLSKYDIYTHPANVKPFGFNDDLERDTSYHGKIDSFRASLDTARLSGIRVSLDVGRSRSPQANSSTTTPEEAYDSERARRTSSTYSHQRDTLFDDYVARQESQRATTERLLGEDLRRHSGASPDGLQGSRSPAIPGRARSQSWTMPRNASYGNESFLGSLAEEDEEPYRNDRDGDALLGGDERRVSDGSASYVTQERYAVGRSEGRQAQDSSR
ncbi:hypothetical protein S40285_02119 [Stachybotrys chlorohalonatus IBT 40285]|uniref:Uncharacterized protein n=1 Tax=Stachybotrys chlorohalonatus (strain IBT 40285) TaxID=1283841 RepID=A0A084QDJ1_STAC4|nr:hypothetical protein S40285_02119 [Stachybotrys chlorohalonata IBT 40285]